MPGDDPATRTFDGDETVGGASQGPPPLAPGVVLADRYRIVARLGAGAMGEVYRADDLKLGQPVALKFLPAHLAGDPLRLAGFHREVRMAREVSHPNVVRVHDIAESEGRHFISMEYVDGEDLASLIRRIGRLPADKGVELARELCLGLAAAHEQGVLHRDLKPANVMIDGRGRVRISDFGLAIRAPDGRSGEVAGTPAYMAPEQFDGEATPATDVYALGLVLYHMFVGEAAFSGGSVSEMAQRQREERPPRPRERVPDIDPQLEELILRCLEKEAAARPSTALSVAASLPGGDPLAALVAAGQTPPPEMIARAKSAAALSTATATGLLVFVLLGLPLGVALVEPLLLFRQVSLDRPPEVLADEARRLLGSMAGEDQAAGDSAFGFAYARPPRGPFAHPDALKDRAPIRFWYRQSPQTLSPRDPSARVSSGDPPITAAGMATVWLDTRGRLLELTRIPLAGAGAASDAWEPLFEAAGLEAGAFAEDPKAAAPPVPSDGRRAWLGEAAADEAPLRVDGASLEGRIVWFRVSTSEIDATDGTAADSTREWRLRATYLVIYVLVLVAGSLLAWRNLSLGRGDRKGAIRLAGYVTLLRLVAWLLAGAHAADPGGLQAGLRDVLRWSLYHAVLLAVLYLAIEPVVRRRWPHSLISWSRLLRGRFADPLVGRDILVGVATAVAMAVVFATGRLAPTWWGEEPASPLVVNLDLLLDTRSVLAWLLTTQIGALWSCLLFTVFFVLLQRLMKSTLLAAGSGILLFTALSGLNTSGGRPTEIVALVMVMGILFFTLSRFGFLATTVTVFGLSNGRMSIPTTTDLSQWYGQATAIWLVVMAGLALYGYWAAIGGSATVKRALLKVDA